MDECNLCDAATTCTSCDTGGTWPLMGTDSVCTTSCVANTQFDDGTKAFRYMLKYVSKTCTATAVQNEVRSAFRTVRLVSTFGTWYRYKVPPEPLPCRVCGKVNWISEWELTQLLHTSLYDIVVVGAPSRAPPLS